VKKSTLRLLYKQYSAALSSHVAASLMELREKVSRNNLRGYSRLTHAKT